MIGTLIADKYELLGEVGKGGLGTVYRAKDRDGRVVAVKIIEAADDDVKLKRLEQGISAARMLNHPNVVTIQDSGTTADNHAFYVTDYIDGQLLSSELKKLKRLPLERAVQIMTQVCDAIDHAHYFGVIHRNLKPANIILTRNPDGSDTAHVLDFGLAKSFFAANKPDHKLTTVGEIVGSPEYMSPEQCMYKEADWRSDIYSAGCLLYHMLVGRPPLKGGNHLGTMMMQVKEAPADPIEAAPDAAIPPAVRDVLLRSLEKDPNNRQQTMILLRDELIEAASGVKDDMQETLRKAAEAGDRNAQFELASYLEKLNTTQNIQEIADWFRKAADQGHADAQFRMGQAYELGLGVKRHAQTAIDYYRGAAEGGREDARLRWLHMAATEGDVDAQVNLALLHKSGTSVPQNLAEVEKWLTKAAEQRFAINAGSSAAGFSGINSRMEQVIEFAFSLANREHPEGCYWLGIIYKDGRGVPVDELQSAKWLIRAADKGHAKAEAELAMLSTPIVDQARRGRPRWDHRKTALPHNLSAESKRLIDAVQNLKKTENLKNRYDLYESFGGASVLVAYEDKALTRMAAVHDADGRAGAAVFADFAAFNQWQTAMNNNFPFSEKNGKELCLQLLEASSDPSLVINPTEKPGVTLRGWELRALAGNGYPVTRGIYLTEMELEPGLVCFSRVPSRPKEAFFHAVKDALSGVQWLTAAFLFEAVFQPVERPPEMTMFVQTTTQHIGQDQLRPVGDALREIMSEHLKVEHTRIIFSPASAEVLKQVRRYSVCAYQRA